MEWKLLLLLSTVALCFTSVSCASERDKLKSDLLMNFDPYHAPEILTNSKGNESAFKPKVTLGFEITQIIKLEVQQNTISLIGWLSMVFTDNRLKWEPASYSGISKLRLPYEELWLPDIVLVNRVSRTSQKNLNAVVYSPGQVVFIVPNQITASCEMDLTYFPYDTQECKLVFGSWSFDKSLLELAVYSDSLGGVFTEHPEWNLMNVSYKLNEKVYPCCPDTFYQDVTITLELKRRSAPYSVKLVIPSVLTAFLILFTFILPSSSGEKIVFCVVLLPSLILLSVYLHITVASNKETVLGEFLTFALFLDFFATIIAVICYNVADALLTRDHLGGHVEESDKHWASRKQKMKILRMVEYVAFFVFLIIFVIGTAVILRRRG